LDTIRIKKFYSFKEIVLSSTESIINKALKNHKEKKKKKQENTRNYFSENLILS